MRRRLHRSVRGRAAIGVVALYALLLQAFLAFAAPSLPPGPADGVLCAEHAAGAPGQDKASAPCHPCCTAAHVGNLAPAPVAASARAGSFPPFVRVAWRPEAAVPKTGPPTHASSARGPPVA